MLLFARRFLILASLCFMATWSHAKTIIKVPITELDRVKIEAFINGRDIRKINSYASRHLDSGVLVEQVLFRKALLLGGLDASFDDYLVPNSARARADAKDGVVVGGGMADWHVYALLSPNDYYESDPVVPDGSYEKGLFTTLAKQKNLRVNSPGDLGKLSMVSSNTWLVDWAALKEYKFAALYSAPTKAMQFKMVEGGRADFTLQDFAGTPDLSIKEEGITLYPVPGVKIGLFGARHYLISKKHPDGATLFAALQKGLAMMQKSGEIKRALTECGFYNQATANWKLFKSGYITR